MGCRLDRHGRLIEQPQLLGQRFQAIGAQDDSLEPDPAPETSGKELDEYGLEIRLPIGAVRQEVLGHAFDMVAVAERQRQAPADTPLLPEYGADPFDQPGQPSQYELIVDFVRIESERLFDQRLVDRWTDRRMVNPQGPVMQHSGGCPEHRFELDQ